MEGRGDDASGGAYLAVVAGIFATGGSLLGKLAGGADASSLVSWRPIRIVASRRYRDENRLRIFIYKFS